MMVSNSSYSHRSRLENTITIGQRISGWPKENTVRGRYYLSQVLLQQAEVKKSLSDRVDGLKMEEASEQDLDGLLKLDDSDIATKHRGDLPMLFDYLVHWENRLVTPRKAIVPATSVAAGAIQTNGTGVVEDTVAALNERNQAAFNGNINRVLKVHAHETDERVDLPIESVTL